MKCTSKDTTEKLAQKILGFVNYADMNEVYSAALMIYASKLMLRGHPKIWNETWLAVNKYLLEGESLGDASDKLYRKYIKARKSAKVIG